MSRKKKKHPMAQPPQKPPEPPTEAPLPAPLRLLDADYSRVLRMRNVRWLIVIGATVGALWLGAYLSVVFVPLLVALGIAYILNPLVVRLQKRGVSRTRAVLLIFLAFIAISISAGVWFATSIVRDVSGINTEAVKLLEEFTENQEAWKDAIRELPGGESVADKFDLRAAGTMLLQSVAPQSSALESPEQQQARASMAASRAALLAEFRVLDRDANLRLDAREIPPPELAAMDGGEKDGTVDLSEWFARFGLPESRAEGRAIAPEALAAGEETLGWLGGALLTLLTIVLFILLVPIYTWYFMVGYDAVVAKGREYLPGAHRERLLRIAREIDSMMRAFFRGRIIVMLIVTVVTVAVYFIFGVKYAVLLGLLAGVGVLIPYFSIVASWVPALILMAVAGDGWGAIVGMSVCFHVIQAIEQYVLTPRLLGNAVELHPVTLLVGVFVMASLLGVFGALLAVPLTAIARTLGREFLLPYFKGLAEEKPRPA